MSRLYSPVPKHENAGEDCGHINNSEPDQHWIGAIMEQDDPGAYRSTLGDGHNDDAIEQQNVAEHNNPENLPKEQTLTGEGKR